jgi:predicted transcriptional regulator
LQINLVDNIVSRKKRRTVTEIIVEILRAASGEGETKDFPGLQEREMNFAHIARYIELLTDENFLNYVESGFVRVYKITEEGNEALKILVNA